MQFKINPYKLFFVLLIAWSPALFAEQKDFANSVNNFYSEDKQNIVINPQHAEFTIKLKSNPATGYAWFLREYNYSLVIPLKHHYQSGDKQLIGSPGYEFWTFRMKPEAFIVPQQTVIRFIYARPWQGAENSTQVVFRLTTTSQ